jgi:hypothetical protein
MIPVCRNRDAKLSTALKNEKQKVGSAFHSDLLKLCFFKFLHRINQGDNAFFWKRIVS